MSCRATGFSPNTSGDLQTPMFSDHWGSVAPRAHGLRAGAARDILPSPRCSTASGASATRRGRRGTWNSGPTWRLAGRRFHCVDEFMAVARIHPESISGSPSFASSVWTMRASVRQKVRGRPEVARDRLYAVLHRVRKFSGHPRRTLTQRLFVYQRFVAGRSKSTDMPWRLARRAVRALPAPAQLR